MIKAPESGEPVDGLWVPVAGLVGRFKAFDNLQVKSDSFTGRIHVAPNQYVLELQGGKKRRQLPAPTITGISPSSGFYTGGDQITITGTNFVSGATVMFGVYTGTSVIWDSSTQLRVTTPNDTFGDTNVTVKVTNPDGQSATYNYFTFIFAAPTISNVTWPGGVSPPDRGRIMEIYGSNFRNPPVVTFNGAEGSGINLIFYDQGHLRVTYDFFTTSEIVVRVTNPDGQYGEYIINRATPSFAISGPSPILAGTNYTFQVACNASFTGSVTLELYGAIGGSGYPGGSGVGVPGSYLQVYPGSINEYITSTGPASLLGSGTQTMTGGATISFTLQVTGAPGPNYGAGGFAFGQLQLQCIVGGARKDIFIASFN